MSEITRTEIEARLAGLIPFTPNPAVDREISILRLALQAIDKIEGTGAKFRHTKKGGIYETIGHAHTQSAEPMRDMTAVVLYRGQDGLIWVRPHAEFRERYSALPTGVE